MNTKMKIGIFASVMLIVSLAAVALSGTYYVGDTGARLAALELDGDLNAMGNTITNASISDSTLSIDGSNITNGTVADARIASTIARDSDLAGVSKNGLQLSINFNDENVMGSTVLDSSPNEMDGTLFRINIINNGSRSQDRYARFNNSRITFRDFKIGNFSDKDFTVRVVFVPNMTSNRDVIIGTGVDDLPWSTTTTYRGWLIYTESNSIRFGISGNNSIGTTIISKTIAHPGGEFDVVAQRKGTNMTLWVNGTLVQEKVLTAGGLGNSNYRPLNIGTAWKSGWYRTALNYTGDIKLVQIWNRSLSPDEISMLYISSKQTEPAYLLRKGGNITGPVSLPGWTNSLDHRINITFNGTFSIVVNGPTTKTIFE